MRIKVESGSLSANFVDLQDWTISCGRTTTSIMPEELTIKWHETRCLAIRTDGYRKTGESTMRGRIEVHVEQSNDGGRQNH